MAASAKLGKGVCVGAFAIIEDDVIISDNCAIHAHAIIHPFVIFGANNQVFPHAVIGGLPQDLSFDVGTKSFVQIGDNNIFREGVTVNRATGENSATRIGSDCFLMNNSHVGHDCKVGDGNIFATGVTLGGHVQVGEKTFIGGGVMVHQFCRIGSLAMVQGATGVSMDIMPYTMTGGFPLRHYRLNTIGLRRNGIVRERYKAVSQAFRKLRLRQGIEEIDETPEILHLRQWLLEKSIRGIHGFAKTDSKTRE